MRAYRIGDAWYIRESLAVKAAKEKAYTMPRNQHLMVQTIRIKMPAVIAALNGEVPQFDDSLVESSVIIQGLGHAQAPMKKK
jgi:hypothetical protein